MASIPEEYFKLYTGEGGAELLKTLPEQEDVHWENEHREYKTGEAFNKITRTKEPQEKAAFANELRATWSEVIGAFANSGGGVLIFGIHAKPEKGIDQPQTVVPVDEPKVLVTRLNKWALDVTDPPLEGIKYEIVYCEGKAGPGFVVCLIPEGKQKPYRSEFCAREFYIRVNDNCISPTLSILKQLFTPQRYPRIKVIVHYYKVPIGHFPFHAHGFFTIAFRNLSVFTLTKLSAYLVVEGPTVVNQENGYSTAHSNQMPLTLDRSYVNPDYVSNAVCGWKGPSSSTKLIVYLGAQDTRQMKAEITLPLPFKEVDEFSAMMTLPSGEE